MKNILKFFMLAAALSFAACEEKPVTPPEPEEPEQPVSLESRVETLEADSAEAKEALADSASYKEIKEWFLKKFPAIAEFHKKHEMLLAA